MDMQPPKELTDVLEKMTESLKRGEVIQAYFSIAFDNGFRTLWYNAGYALLGKLVTDTEQLRQELVTKQKEQQPPQ